MPPSPAVACAQQTLAGLDDSQRVGQLFLFGVEGNVLSPAELSAIQTYHLGSVFLNNTRNGGVAVVRALADSIQVLATEANTHSVRFFIAADQEGGLVQRLQGSGFSQIPTAVDQGQLTPPTLQAKAATWGRELASAGVNLDLAPVMDVVPAGTGSQNAPIGALKREYGNDPATAGARGAAVVKGMAMAGIATTLKHFPGLGRVVGNTDRAADVVDSVTTPDDAYLDSFRAGIQAGAPFVMISLATYTLLDPANLAAFSPAIIGNLLRGRLGYDGVVMSDDIGATASVASISPGDRATAFIDAGGDFMIVAGADAVSHMAAAVLGRVRSDSAFAAKVEAAALAVLRAKSAYGLLACD